MRVRTSSYSLLVALTAACLVSCEEPPASSTPRALDPNDGGTCAMPEPGCACEPGSEPEICYLEPITEGDQYLCQQGTMICNSGEWSACTPIRSYQITAGDKALGTPTACNPCNPACNTHTTTPNQSDLTPGNSAGVTYNPGAPGIVVDAMIPGAMMLTDTDGDGYPDVVDDCNGPGIRAPCDGDAYSIIEDGFFFNLPPGTAATGTYPPINLQLQSADVYVLQDASGSMADEIANIRTNLTSGTIGVGSTCAAGMGGGLIGAIRCAIPNSEFGSGMTREYPYNGGDDYQTPFTPLLDITTSLSTAQLVINAYSTQGNQQGWPEATGQALYAIGSGRGLGRWLPDRGTCPNGGRGYPCFRTNAIPIVLVITDAPFNNGPTGNAYSTSRYNQAGFDLPQSITLDQANRSALVAETAGTSFDLGDLTNRSVTVAGTTSGMGNDYTLPASCSPYGAAGNGPDAVFRFTLTAARTIRIRTEGSDYDGMIALRTNAFATSTATSNIITCDDDSGGITDPGNNEVYDYAANVVANLAAGTYYIQMDGYAASNAGAFQLRIFNETSPTGGRSTTPAVTHPWSDTVTALNGIGAKTIGVATCSCAQGWTNYSTCRQSYDWTLGQFCQAAFNQCMTLPADAFSSNRNARCATLRTACGNSVVAEANAPSSCLTIGTTSVRSRACSAARASCATSPAGSNSQCNGIENACNGVTDVCGTYNAGACCSDGDCTDTLYDLRAMGTATSSVDSAGRPFVYGAATNGSGLSGTIVDAIVDLAAYLALDVDVVCVDNPATATVNECTAFQVSVAPNPSCPATCTGGRTGDRCLDCAPGTNFNFQVNVNNIGVPQTTMAQVFTFNLVARADQTTNLLTVPVRVLVPPMAPMTTPQSGTFVQVYDATVRCVIPPQRPVWGNLTHSMTVPANTTVQLQVRTADSLAALPTAGPVLVNATNASPAPNPINITTLLQGAGISTQKPYLSVTAVLTTNAARTVSPVLRQLTMVYTCQDIE